MHAIQLLNDVVRIRMADKHGHGWSLEDTQVISDTYQHIAAVYVPRTRVCCISIWIEQLLCSNRPCIPRNRPHVPHKAHASHTPRAHNTRYVHCKRENKHGEIVKMLLILADCTCLCVCACVYSYEARGSSRLAATLYNRSLMINAHYLHEEKHRSPTCLYRITTHLQSGGVQVR